ncbi:sensor histidine kinase [Dehalogenimonas etheniformans]|nr:sensor histidine kinase [Dehalogenimonas etheniformans]QNT75733.1 histidine kinase [Dehalogenimonas etheniformans]
MTKIRFPILTALAIGLLMIGIIPIDKVIAQDYAYFEHLSIEQGLSQSSGLSLLQDEQGFIWFGTKDGLNRFDGVSFRVFRNDPLDPKSISDNYINSIVEDSYGTIWAGTLNGGLNLFNKIDSTFVSYKHLDSDPNTIISNLVRVVKADAEGFLWIGTPVGLDRFDPKTQKFTHFVSNPMEDNSLIDNYIWALLLDSKGNLWIGTEAGLDRYNIATNAFTHYLWSPGSDNGLSGTTIRALFEDSSGQIWISTSNGLDVLNTVEESWKHFTNEPENAASVSNNRIRAITEDLEGNIWVGTTYGLNKYDKKTNSFIRFFNDPGNIDSLSNDVIWSLLVDRSGIVWIGTLNGGVEKYIPSKQAFLCLRNNPGNQNSLSNNVVKAIFQDSKGVFWFGTLGGINSYNPKTSQIIKYAYDPKKPLGLPNDSIKTIIEDKKGSLWIGTTGGLAKLDPQSGDFRVWVREKDNPNSLSDDVIWSLYFDGANNLWIGTNSGLDRFDPSTETIERFGQTIGIPSTTIYTIIEKNGYLLIGTGSGIFEFSLNKGISHHYISSESNTSSLSSNIIRHIFKSKSGEIWIATHNGIDKFDTDAGTFIRYIGYRESQFGVVYGILEDNSGALWFSGNNGLYRMDPRGQNIRHYDVSDGLQSNEFSEGAFYKDNNGWLLFGGINGLNWFDPAMLEVQNKAPELVITGINTITGTLKLSEPAHDARTISLNYKNNSLVIDFAALEYISPTKTTYSFKLDGFDSEWRTQNFDQRSVSYTNLPKGTFTFFLRASQIDGEWETETLSLTIKVAPPFWNTWWFYILSAVAAAFFTLSIIRLRVASVTRQKERLEILVDRRTVQLKEEVEKHKITESKLSEEIEDRVKYTRALVHELKTPLTSLSISSELLADVAQTEPYYSLSKVIDRAVNRLDKRCAELLDLAKGESGVLKVNKQELDPNIFFENLYNDLVPVASNKGIAFDYEHDDSMPIMSIDPERIGEVVLNLVDNALKFTPEGGKVTLDVRSEGNGVIVSVTDTGSGIDPEILPHLFEPKYQTKNHNKGDGLGLGLVLSRMFVELHGGRLTVSSVPEKGSTFRFNLPGNGGNIHESPNY